MITSPQASSIGHSTRRDRIALVVLYKRSPEESESLQSLLRTGFLAEWRLVVWDNDSSAENEANLKRMFAGASQVDYLSNGRNESLSKIYNRIAELYNPTVLSIWDQDTLIPARYFTELNCQLEQNRCAVYAPVVHSQSLTVSPGRLHGFRGKHLKECEPGVYETKGYTCITSGLALNMQDFSATLPAFDERLSFYGIDTRFFLDLAKNSHSFVVLDVHLQHNTALWEAGNNARHLTRFRMLRASWPLVFEPRGLQRIQLWAYTVYISVKQAFRRQDIRYLF